jgi:hypothetical protein
MGQRRRPSSRRDRRQEGRRARSRATRGADRTFLVIVGLIVLVLLVGLAAIFISSGGL